MEEHTKTYPAKVDGREQRAEESRARILKAATGIFAEKGPMGARVDEIADAAGINKRMLYHYFGSKENLYEEVLRNNYCKIHTLSKKAINLADDPKANVARAIRAYFYFLVENEAFVRLTSWEALYGGRCAGKLYPQFFDLIELEFDDLIKDGMERGYIQSHIDIRHVLLSVHALCLVYFTQQEVVQSLWQEDMFSEEMLEACLQHILNLIFNGLFIST